MSEKKLAPKVAFLHRRQRLQQILRAHAGYLAHALGTAAFTVEQRAVAS